MPDRHDPLGPCACPTCLLELQAAAARGRAKVARERAAWAGMRAELARRQVLSAMRDLKEAYAVLHDAETFRLLQLGPPVPSA